MRVDTDGCVPTKLSPRAVEEDHESGIVASAFQIDISGTGAAEAG
ncbi:hypothetical protein [Rhodococcus sp. 15-649-2-2]|nr:hypothetical protein [Rhodococcus sp. 15-649-2-2]